MKYTIEDGVTQSMLSSFLTCRQRALYELDLWEEVGTTKFAAMRGDFFHTVLEKWYDLSKTIGKENNDGVVRLFLYATEKTWLSKQKQPPEQLEEILSFTFSVFPTYVKRWLKSDMKFKWESLEEVFDVRWKGYRLRGKFDGVLILNGQRWLFETKTKAQINEDSLLDELTFNFQNLFYLNALKIMGRPAVGVIYNIVRTPSLRIGKAEHRDKFVTRVEEDINNRRDWYFKRYEITYDAKTVARFEQDLNHKLIEFDGWLKGVVPTYRNETACVSFFKCSYLKACASDTLIGYKQTRTLFRELLDDANKEDRTKPVKAASKITKVPISLITRTSGQSKKG